MNRLSFARIYAFGVIAALAVYGVLALLERNPQATATLVASGVLMLVALAHASALSRGPAGALTFMHHLSGAAISVAVAATSFAAAYLLNKDTDTSNPFAMSLALVHLAISITMLMAHVAGAYADLHVMHGEAEEGAAAPTGLPIAGSDDVLPPSGGAAVSAAARRPWRVRWRMRATAKSSA